MARSRSRPSALAVVCLLAAVSTLSALPAGAVVVNVPSSCDVGGSPPCSCVGNVCSPNAPIRQLKIEATGYTFDCSVGGFPIGGTSTSDREADPIVEIDARSVTLKNCTVQHGTGQGVWAHNTLDVTLIGNTISDTLKEGVTAAFVGSTSGPSGTGVVLERNIISKARNVAQGPGDNAVGLYGLTAGSSVSCNVISSESNGVTNNGNSTLHSQCNAFLQYGTKYVPSGFSPIAELSEQGSGMHSEHDCVVTFGDNTNPLIPTRCRADAAWNSACSALLAGTCLDPLSAFGSFSLAVSTYDHDEDGDGVVDWRDPNHDGVADVDTFGIGSVGRNGDVTNTTVEHALLLGVQRALWASAVQPTHTNHTVNFHDNKVISIGSTNLSGVGALVTSADGLTVQDNAIVGTNFGIVTDNAAQTGYPIEIAGNHLTSAPSWSPANSFGVIQLQHTKLMPKESNRIHDNTVTSWKGYGITLLGGGTGVGPGVSIYANHLTDVLGIAFDFEELTGSDPLDIEVRNNDATIVTGPATDTEGFYLSFTGGQSTLSIHDNEIQAHTMFDRGGDAYSSFSVFHNVFQPAGTAPIQTEGTPNLHLITNTATSEGNNWDTHCNAAIPSAWSDVPAGTLSPATVDPHAYEGTASIDRPWDSGYEPGCFGTRPIEVVSQTTAATPAGSGAGAAVRRCGDLDGDGLADQCVGAPRFHPFQFGASPDEEPGAVFVYFGSTSAAERAQPDIIFTGVGAHDRAGVSLAGDFDFNGDGHPDIVIGAEQVDRTTDPDNPTPTGKGKVYVIFFDLTDTTHYPHIADPDVADVISLSLVGQPGGIPGVVFEGVAFGDQAGFSVDAGGTSTPSLATDIVIGAPGADPGGRTDAGAVYVVFDSAALSGDVSLTRISDGLQDEVPGKAYLGGTTGDNLGFSTAFGGSVVEGQDPATGTVLMGAPSASGSMGRLIAPPGDPDTTPIIVDAIGSTQSGFQITGTQIGEQLGYAAADGGDALADGVPDVLIGSPTYDVGGLTDAGRVLQTTQMIPTGVYTADAVGTSIDGVTWTGEATGDQLGFAVSGISDVTGDGYDDVVFGAPFVDVLVSGVPQLDAGAVYLINGQPVTGPLGIHSVDEVGTTIPGQEFTGAQAGEHAGSSVAGLGDFNGDGTDDFAVGSPDGDSGAGTVYMVLYASPPPVGECGPSGCVVADFVTGATVDVPPGGLPTTITLTTQGILDASVLPAPVPAGKMLFGAARFAPEGQSVLPPFATIHIPTLGLLAGQFAPTEVLPLSYFDGAAWVDAAVSGTTGANPTHPTQIEVVAVVGVLHVYAVFVNDADGDEIRDTLDNCPVTPNPGQLDTNHDGVGDACQCLSVDCADANACTDDSCSPASGCVHANNVAACDDGNPCTVGDVCGSGVCGGTTITSPAETGDLEAAPDKIRITWSATLYAASYDVVSGLIPGSGSVSYASSVCLASVSGTTYDDLRSGPPTGTGFWYLVRGRNACGVGTYGSSERDVGVSSCP